MATFNVEEYESVADRIERFYRDHKDGAIHTFLRSAPENISTVIFEAHLFIADKLVSTGWALETEGGTGFVNKTSWLENAETSAIGRALANYNYKTKKRPSKEEMLKTQSRLSEKNKKSSQANSAIRPISQRAGPPIGDVNSSAIGRLRADYLALLNQLKNNEKITAEEYEKGKEYLNTHKANSGKLQEAIDRWKEKYGVHAPTEKPEPVVSPETTDKMGKLFFGPKEEDIY